MGDHLRSSGELEGICHQAAFISSCDQLVLKWQLEQNFERYWREGFAESRHYSPRRFIFFDLIHALLRNHHWWVNPLMLSSLNQYIVERYGIAQDFSQSLVSRIAVDFGKFFPLSPQVEAFFGRERNFVDFVLIKALTAKSWEIGIRELGLGPFLFEQISKCSQDNVGASDQVIFCSDLEKSLRHEIQVLSEQKAKVPWAFDIYRLGFLMVPDLIEMGIRPQLHSYQVLFQCLLCIGQVKTLERKEVNSILSNLVTYYEKTELFDEEMVSERLLKSLRACAYIDADWSRGARSSQAYRLTVVGYELTQNAYAWQKRLASLDFEDFCQLPHPWQGALLALGVRAKDGILAQIFSTKPLLHPHVVEVIAGLDLNAHEQEDLASIVRKGIKDAPTLESRRLYCQLATQVLAAEEAVSLLKPMLASDQVGAKLRESVALSLLGYLAQDPKFTSD